MSPQFEAGEPVFGSPEPGAVYVERPCAYAFIENGDRWATMRTSFGLFLPGGGLDPGESDLVGLKRELFEELGVQLVKASPLGRASQYLYSRHYKQHFLKRGRFFACEVSDLSRVVVEKDHELVWLTREQAALQLSEEFQRWAVETWV